MPPVRYLGIDFGTKRVGVAVSNEDATIAFPRMTLPNDDRLLHEVVRVMRQDGIEGAVFGDSQNGRGEDNKIMAPTRAFAEEVRKSGFQIFWHPEMYTTAQAERAPRSSAATIDASAAAVMLQSFLDLQAHGRR